MADDLKILDARPAVPKKPNSIEWVPGKIRKLSEIKVGHPVKIMAVQLPDPARGQLYAQGLVESKKAVVLHNDHRGRVMLKMHGEVYLLGRRETCKIQVREYIPRH